MGLYDEIQATGSKQAAPPVEEPPVVPAEGVKPPIKAEFIGEVYRPKGMKGTTPKLAAEPVRPVLEEKSTVSRPSVVQTWRRPMTWVDRVLLAGFCVMVLYLIQFWFPFAKCFPFLPAKVAVHIVPVLFGAAVIGSAFLPGPLLLTCCLMGYWGFSRIKLEWDRNTFCRGWIITGATGSGKTEAGINRLVHQVCLNETGVVRDNWEGSELQRTIEEEEKSVREKLKKKSEEAGKLQKVISTLKEEKLELETRNAIANFRQGSGEKGRDEQEELENEIIGVREELAALDRLISDKADAKKKAAAESRGDDEKMLAEEMEKFCAQVQPLNARLLDLHNQINHLKVKFEGPLAVELQKKQEEIEAAEQAWMRLTDEMDEEWFKFGEKMRKVEHLKYVRFPWAGLCVDEKGTYWQTLEPTMAHYKRSHHLMLLQTRPSWASANWKPRAKFNLISNEKIPANTYASAISTTAQSMAGGSDDKAFFKFQAESNIGWAIEMLRTIKRAQLAARMAREEVVNPNLKTVKEILTNYQKYTEFLVKVGAKPSGSPEGKKVDEKVKGEGQDISPAPPKAARLVSPKLTECIEHFDGTGYWKQPKDQLGGVIGTVHNYLNFLTTDDVAEVFCGENTVDINEMDKGIVFCLAMPQQLRIERRFVCTLLKILFYNHVQSREQPGYQETANMLILWQDEAQRFAIEQDGDVDTIRSKIATTVMATQSLKSMYQPLGGKEKAEVILLNLRNRMIFTGADEDCARSNAEFIGKAMKSKTSYSYGKGGRTRSVSKDYQYSVEPAEIRALPKFTAYVCHADEGAKRMFLYPITPDGRIPRWMPSAMRDFGKALKRYRKAVLPKPMYGLRLAMKLARLFNGSGDNANL